MKRTKKEISILGKIMVFVASIGCICWVVALVTLIFNLKLAITSFIIAGVLFIIYVFFALVWGLYLKLLRKKIAETATRICDYIKRKQNLVGNFEVEVSTQYLLFITFYTPNLNVLNEDKLRRIIKDNVPKEIFLVYKEVLQD